MDEQQTRMACPHCGGRKGSYGFIDPPPGPAPHWIPCTTCYGSGTVTIDVVALASEGKRVRDRRIALGIGLRAGARLLGCDAVTLSDIERGHRTAPDGWQGTLEQRAKH